MTWINLQGITLSEKDPIIKGNILYNSTYLTFLKCKGTELVVVEEWGWLQSGRR
jgi:hypothetical protein